MKSPFSAMKGQVTYSMQSFQSQQHYSTMTTQLSLKLNVDFVSASLDSDEAYTSEFHLNLVRLVFGGKIDIDPCTTKDNRTKAGQFFTKMDNSLIRNNWNPQKIEDACCFMNPPYSAGFQQAFLEKLAEQINLGHIKEAITLTLDGVLHNEGTKRLVVSRCSRVAMAGRIKFVDADGNSKGASNPRDHIFVYFGENPQNFVEVFGQHFPIYQPVK